MFNQQPFGSTNSVTPAFGSTAFGSTTFGTSSGNLFGQTQSAQPTTFGTSTGFGTQPFGQPAQPAQQPNPFATATSAFGAAPNPFGQPTQPAQSTGLFGTTTLFGQQSQPQQPTFGQTQPQQSTSLFGNTTPSLFGQPKPAFGTGPAFGQAPQASNSMFSQPAPTGSLFGATTSNMFGTPSSTSMFGTQSGTTIKFAPFLGTDAAIKNGQQSNVTTKNYCICTMKEYEEKKSMEELRLEDYGANRKSGTAGSATTSSMFGTQPQPSTTGGGLFGQSTSAFGTPTGFGQTQNKPTFGTGGMFGQQPTVSQPSANIFGSTSTTGSMFGSTAPSLFGTPTATSAAPSAFATPFGGTPSAFGGFAQQNAVKPLFGSTTPFGSTATTSTPSLFSNTFGQQSTAQPLFGGPAKPMFGMSTTTTAAPSPFGAFPTFGKPITTSAPFGIGTNTTTSTFPSFGTAFPTASQQQQPSLFSNAAKPLFPTTASTGFGGFGTSTSGGLFGQPANTSLFGTNQLTQQQPLSPQSSSSGNIHAQMAEMMRHGGSDTDVLSNMYAQLPAKEKEKPAPLSRDAINRFIDRAKKDYPSPSGSARKDVYQYYVAPSHKSPGFSTMVANGPISWRPNLARRDDRLRLDRAYIEKVESELINKTRVDTPRPRTNVSQVRSSVYQGTVQSTASIPKDKSEASPPLKVYNIREALDRDGTGDDQVSEASAPGSAAGDDDENLPTGNQAVVLNRQDYFTIPPVSELVLDDSGQCMVTDFLVGRYSHGYIQFLGKTNIARMNLDSLITIDGTEVCVYPDDDKKPPIGKGFNKKAIITFENIWPNNEEDSEFVKNFPEDSGFKEFLRARVVAMMENAEFLSYDQQNGQLSFSIPHF